MPRKDDNHCNPDELQARCDTATKLLSEILGRLDDGDVFDNIDQVSVEAKSWWDEHKRLEREREMDLAATARKKLSADELKALLKYGHLV